MRFVFRSRGDSLTLWDTFLHKMAVTPGRAGGPASKNPPPFASLGVPALRQKLNTYQWATLDELVYEGYLQADHAQFVDFTEKLWWRSEHEKVFWWNSELPITWGLVDTDLWWAHTIALINVPFTLDELTALLPQHKLDKAQHMNYASSKYFCVCCGQGMTTIHTIFTHVAGKTHLTSRLTAPNFVPIPNREPPESVPMANLETPEITRLRQEIVTLERTLQSKRRRLDALLR